jgi:hypothetical protein
MEGLSALVQQQSEEHEKEKKIYDIFEKEAVVWVDESQTRRPPAKIWWGCPCIKGMMESPCKEQFKQVFPFNFLIF